MDKQLYKPFKYKGNAKKKFSVYVMKNGKKKLIHFGHSDYQDFRQHKDKARQKSYLARSAGIRNKEGKLTANDKNSSNYWARTLWK